MTACAIRRRRALRGAVVGLGMLLVPAAAPAGAEPKTPARAHEHVYRVRPGDTLGAIAQRYGVTVEALVVANHLPSQGVVIRVGQRLVIPSQPAPDRATAMTPLRAPRRVAALPPPPNLILRLPDFGDLLPLFLWPAPGPVTSSFGRRRSGWHTGIDIKGDRGVPITASAPGVVIASGFERRYGRVVKIQHINGFLTVYAHNDRNLVRVGDRVLTGQTIAAIGRTGRATASHVHFEIRHDGRVYNPLYLLALPPGLAVADANDTGDHEALHD